MRIRKIILWLIRTKKVRIRTYVNSEIRHPCAGSVSCSHEFQWYKSEFNKSYSRSFCLTSYEGDVWSCDPLQNVIVGVPGSWPINQPSHKGSRPHPCETRRVSRIRIWRQTRAQEEEGIITLCLVAHLRGTYPYSHFLGSRKKSFGKTLKSSKLWTSLITLRSYLY